METNLLSLFECIEELNFKIDKNKAIDGDKLIMPIEFQLVSFWISENVNKDNILEIKIQLTDTDKNILNQFKNKILVKKGISRFRNRLKIQGFPVIKSGRYYYSIMQKKEGDKNYKIVSELPVDVKINFN